MADFDFVALIEQVEGFADTPERAAVLANLEAKAYERHIDIDTDIARLVEIESHQVAAAARVVAEKAALGE